MDTVGRCTTSYLLAGPACLWRLVCFVSHRHCENSFCVRIGGWRGESKVNLMDKLAIVLIGFLSFSKLGEMGWGEME